MRYIVASLFITGVSAFSGFSSILKHRSNLVHLSMDSEDKALKYCEDVTKAIRRPTRTIMVGKVPIGSEHPVAKQTMCTTSTRDVEASVAQILRIAEEGAELVRLTVQGQFEAKACMRIRESLWEKGCDIPLVADIHFAPAVAMTVADAFEKIRVNPGNFADGIKSFEDKVYNTREEFDADLVHIEELFKPLILKCKEKNRAMRIGTNHGSLSARVMSYWGDSPRGMVESAIEFAEMCRKYDYHNFLFSMKASNPLVMVQAYRLLAHEMYNRGWDYPLHLGVTEAGEGEDGRMKSAIGIGTLLSDGLGDTIRVSLTEDPELELVPCKTLASIGEEYLNEPDKYEGIPSWRETPASRNFIEIQKRRGTLPGQLPEDKLDMRGLMHRDGSVFSVVTLDDLANPAKLYAGIGAKTVVGLPFKDIATSDSIYLPEVPPASDKEKRRTLTRMQEVAIGVFAPIEQLQANPLPNSVAVVPLTAWAQGVPDLPEGSVRFAVTLSGTEDAALYDSLVTPDERLVTLICDVPSPLSRVHTTRRLYQVLSEKEITVPVIHSLNLKVENKDNLILRCGQEAGALFVDGLGDGIMIHDPGFDLEVMRTTSFNLLQGCRMRSVKTDFVSCPSCGRTLFDLQEVTEQIKQKTGHLPGVAIAIMGCIVNGPGEMADADFGYVGGAPGKVDLYVGKTVVKRGIPNAVACDALVQLIKDNDRWVDPPKPEETVGGGGGGDSQKELVEA